MRFAMEMEEVITTFVKDLLTLIFDLLEMIFASLAEAFSHDFEN